jgi:hypothetical protein
VFPVWYGLNLYILFSSNSAFKSGVASQRVGVVVKGSRGLSDFFFEFILVKVSSGTTVLLSHSTHANA